MSAVRHTCHPVVMASLTCERIERATAGVCGIRECALQGEGILRTGLINAFGKGTTSVVPPNAV
jgi:hypothetical protein